MTSIDSASSSSSSVDLDSRFRALMASQIPGTDDGGVSIEHYHELNREMYALLKDSLAEVDRLQADLEHTRQIVAAQAEALTEIARNDWSNEAGSVLMRRIAIAALKSRLDAADVPAPPHIPTSACVDTCDNPFVCKDLYDAWIAVHPPADVPAAKGEEN